MILQLPSLHNQQRSCPLCQLVSQLLSFTKQLSTSQSPSQYTTVLAVMMPGWEFIPLPRIVTITESDGSICVILARQLLPYPHNHPAITRSECFRMVATTWSPSINLASKNTIQQLTRFNQRSKKLRNLAPISGVMRSINNEWVVSDRTQSKPFDWLKTTHSVLQILT